MRRLHSSIRPAAVLLVLVGCTADGPRVEVGPYETQSVPLALVLPASRFGAQATLLDVVDDDGAPLPEAVRRANRLVRDSVERFVLSLAPEAVPDSVEADFVAVTGRTERLYVSDAAYSTLVTLSVGSGDGEGTVVYLPVTIDLARGEAVRLGDLFAPGTGWEEALAATVRTATLAAVPGAEATQVPDSGFDALAGPDPAFTLGPDALALHVPPRRLVSTALHAEVAYSALARYARPDGLLDRLGG